MPTLNLTEYRDKVYGCWLGKNIGGTLGTPFEGQRTTNDCTFYVQERTGNPLPNDDLDLQLVWLNMIERHGIYNLTPHLVGDYWASFIIGPWNEYSVAHLNVRNGFYPPLSGAVNNDHWKFSNGAWIRSEIWACMFPGNPDEAIRYAYMDSCADHCGEGIYAEMFTTALESAAFVVSDLRELIRIGLAKVPADSRVAASVKLVCDMYDDGKDWLDTRNAVVELNKDLGWFQAPANVAFATLGLLYGEGDFGKSICRAVNCGDDTDCTGATAASILGIINGRKGIPDEWLEPIGESIITCAINKFGIPVSIPNTIGKLTARVVRCAVDAMNNNLACLRLTDAPTDVTQADIDRLYGTDAAQKIWSRSPYSLQFPLTNADLHVIYENPVVTPGVPVKVTVAIGQPLIAEGEYALRWRLPESWTVDKPEARVCVKSWWEVGVDFTITPGTFNAAFEYPVLEVRLPDRNFPTLLSVPFQLKDSVTYIKDGDVNYRCPDRDHQLGRITALANNAK